MDNKQFDRGLECVTSKPMSQAYPPSYQPGLPHGDQQYGGQPYGGHPYSPSQQQHVTNTTVVIQQPVNQKIQRDWNSGICGCFEDCTSCMGVTCFPSCYACHLSARMDESCCLPLCVPGFLIALRTKMRAEQNIVGSICNDCLTVACCGPCVMCQLAREVDHVRKSPV